MSIRIAYEADGFPVGSPVVNGASSLAISWDKLLWAALTVGRPNRHCVLKHGRASVYEALFRLSLVRMNLEQTGFRRLVLRRTEAARSLDPTEKGAINYFLGMTVAKLFAAELLATPWMLHLDVFRSQLRVVLTERSRPDLIGQDASGNWIALECKGRVSLPQEDAKAKAKRQAQRVVTVGGVIPAFAIGAVTYFRNDTLQFFWRDPQPDPTVKDAFSIEPTDDMWDQYYALVRSLMLAADQKTNEDVVWAKVDGADIDVGVHHRVWAALQEHGGDKAKRVADDQKGELGPCNADGIALRAGESWSEPFVDAGQEIKR